MPVEILGYDIAGWPAGDAPLKIGIIANRLARCQRVKICDRTGISH